MRVSNNGLSDLSAQRGNVVVPRRWNDEEGKAGIFTGANDEGVAVLTIFPLVGPVIEFNATDRSPGVGLTQHKVKMLPRYLVERRLPSTPIRRILWGQHIGYPHFTKDDEKVGCRLAEGLIEVPL